MGSNKNLFLFALLLPLIPANLNGPLGNLQRSTDITTVLRNFLSNQVDTFRLENIDILKSGVENCLYLNGCVWLVY